MNAKELVKVIENFDIEEIDIQRYGSGHINDTYVVTQNGVKMLLQRLNTNIFKNPEGVMDNIVNVTAHLRNKIAAAGGDPERETMTVINAADGKPYFITDSGKFFRMYKFIENNLSVDKAQSTEQMTSAAETLGKFYHMLDDYPADTLSVAIPKFHDTRNYYNRLMGAIENNAAGRVDSVQAEIKFVKDHEFLADILNNGLADGSIPLRVTHNDTKLNNILFDAATGKGLCVIDLDTVMPGSLLYDFGDAMRFGAASGPEDEKDLSKIWFDLDMFEAFTKGFASEMKDTLTEGEIANLVNSVKILTFECGMRFLEDHINGDTYFKIHRENHNIDRARTQFKLVADMEVKTAEMEAIVAKYCK